VGVCVGVGVCVRVWVPKGTGAAGAEVMPTEVPLRAPDMSKYMSCDMRLLAASEEVVTLITLLVILPSD
jgi:hypothetical protein